jgi:outer membrane protein OmpA-like peptidoglycan-associated protein
MIMSELNSGKNLAILALCLAIPLVFVAVNERRAGARIAETGAEASNVPIASAAEYAYCTAQLKQVVRRVAGACGLVDNGARGCKPADAKSVASLTGDDFNALFKPLQNRAHIIEYDNDQTELDEPARKELEKYWSEKNGASFFFVVSRASADGDAAYNSQLSQARAQSVLGFLTQKFPGDEDLKKVGLLWLGEEYAQLTEDFCSWNRSRDGACTVKDINRSAFVAWIDCSI